MRGRGLLTGRCKDVEPEPNAVKGRPEGRRIDDGSRDSIEPLDAVADTISGPVADQLIAKVKAGGIFASVIGAPSKASAFPNVKMEVMQVKADTNTLLHMADAVRTGRLAIPVGERFALKDAGKAHAAAEKGAVGKLLLLA